MIEVLYVDAVFFLDTRSAACYFSAHFLQEKS
jgi:hypothetical protein